MKGIEHVFWDEPVSSTQTNGNIQKNEIEIITTQSSLVFLLLVINRSSNMFLQETP
jgi:hypothetical protein